jgi:glycosyltransferase involved in cell wall biosynthesis
MDASRRPGEVEFHVLAQYELTTDEGCGHPVTRCWKPHSTDFVDLAQALAAIEPDLVHIQFQWAYFSSDSLAKLIAVAKSAGLPAIVSFHTTSDLPDGTDSLSRAFEMLRQADLLLVHTAADVETLRGWGLESNVRLNAIGNFVADDESPDLVRESLGLSSFAPIIASFGFLQPHKGIKEAIEAVALLRENHPDILYLAVCAVQQNPESEAYRLACLNRARELGIADRALVFGKFLDNTEVLTALHASDLVVLPYYPTGESASGALTFALSSRRPVVTTAQPIFSSVADVVRQIDSPEPALIAQAVEELLADSGERRRLATAASAYIESTSWPVVAEGYLALVRVALAGRE